MSSGSRGGDRVYSNPAPIIALIVLSFLTGCKSEAGRDNANSDLKRLMEQLNDPQARMQDERQAPLHIAAEDGHTNEVERLLANGAKVDELDKWLRTPLHLAAEWGYTGIVRDLLAAGADVNAETRLGETPLFFALRYQRGDEDEVSAKENWKILANTLLSAGAKIDLTNSTGLTPLHLAAGARNGDPDVVRQLIERGANVNAAEKSGDTVLHFAVLGDNPEMVKLLLDAGAKVEVRGPNDTPLHCAANRSRGAEIAKLLLRAGADVNTKDDEGETPLHHVPFFCCGTPDCARELMSAGADPNAKSENGRTPLHKAAEWGRADIVSVLLEGKALINATDNEGKTPLDLAIEPDRLVSDAKASATVALLKKRGGHRGAQPRAK